MSDPIILVVDAIDYSEEPKPKPKPKQESSQQTGYFYLPQKTNEKPVYVGDDM